MHLCFIGKYMPGKQCDNKSWNSSQIRNYEEAFLVDSKPFRQKPKSLHS